MPQLIRKADGKVWELSVPERAAREWEAKATVANFRHEGKNVILRVISDTKPEAGAIPCEAALEDLYLYYFGTGEGEN